MQEHPWFLAIFYQPKIFSFIFVLILSSIQFKLADSVFLHSCSPDLVDLGLHHLHVPFPCSNIWARLDLFPTSYQFQISWQFLDPTPEGFSNLAANLIIRWSFPWLADLNGVILNVPLSVPDLQYRSTFHLMDLLKRNSNLRPTYSCARYIFLPWLMWWSLANADVSKITDIV